MQDTWTMNMQGTFWSAFGVKFSSPGSNLDAILAKRSFTLEEILDEDELLQDKNHSTTLRNYLGQKSVVCKCVEYVIMTPDQDEQKEALRYPYICSEVFAIELGESLETLANNEDLLELLFSLLKRPAPLDPSSASYFKKVVFILAQKKYEKLLHFLKTHRSLISCLLDHIGLYSMMEILIMIGWDEATGTNHDLQWLYKENMVPKLVAKLAPEHQYEYNGDVHAHAARTLVDVVVKCPVGRGNFLVSHLQSAPVLEQLFKHMFSGCASSLTHCISVVSVLLQLIASQNEEFDIEVDDDEWGLYTPDPLVGVHVHLEELFNVLRTPAKVEALRTQCGSLDPPLGEARMKVVELFLVLFRCNSTKINQDLIRLNVLGALLELFFHYQWNNMLHSLVENVFNFILMSDYNELKDALFVRAKLVDCLIAGYERNERQRKERRRLRCGYMGHLLRLVGTLNGSTDPALQKHLEGNPKWGPFLEAVSSELEQQTIVLGGVRPTVEESVDSDDDVNARLEDSKQTDWSSGLVAGPGSSFSVSQQAADADAVKLEELMNNMAEFDDDEWDAGDPGLGSSSWTFDDKDDIGSDEDEYAVLNNIGDSYIGHGSSSSSSSSSSDSDSDEDEPREPLPELPGHAADRLREPIPGQSESFPEQTRVEPPRAAGQSQDEPREPLRGPPERISDEPPEQLPNLVGSTGDKQEAGPVAEEDDAKAIPAPFNDVQYWRPTLAYHLEDLDDDDL